MAQTQQTQQPDSDKLEATHSFLCLKCRKQGHRVKDCPQKHWNETEAWVLSPERQRLRLDALLPGYNGQLCQRCSELRIIQMLETSPPWQKQEDLNKNFPQQTDYVRNLGAAGEVKLWSDCPLCCMLFAITLNPSSNEQEMFLVPDWTLSRVSNEKGKVEMAEPEQRTYATCIISMMSWTTRVRETGHRGDALCLLDNDIAKGKGLGGRLLPANAHSANSFDHRKVSAWIERCRNQHGNHCLPAYSPALEGIKLIDVNRRKVVAYPRGGGCDYIALSYVVGQTTSPINVATGPLPRTLEDAIHLTKLLEKQYLWIDSQCIDQTDDAEKRDQIYNRMASIYQGAWLTVLALSADSRDAGLSRFSRTEQFSQLSCNIGDRQLVSLMPTLSHQIWKSPWAERAWTLQEATLSARCLFLSDQQMYYVCAAMQCCETLDESRSRAHTLITKDVPASPNLVSWMSKTTGADMFRIPTDDVQKRLEHWGDRLTLYSKRHMTDDRDAINAFAGIEKVCQSMYRKGFFWGLPEEDFDWALAWRSLELPKRRTTPTTSSFPTWSWSGWKVSLYYGRPMDMANTRRIPTPLLVEAVRHGSTTITTICKRHMTDSPMHLSSLGIEIAEDVINNISTLNPSEPDFGSEDLSVAGQRGYLFLTAVCLQWTPDLSAVAAAPKESPDNERIFGTNIQNTPCFISIVPTDEYVLRQQRSPTEDTFVLLARENVWGELIAHLLLLVKFDATKRYAERVTTLRLVINRTHHHILKALEPRKRRFVLR